MKTAAKSLLLAMAKEAGNKILILFEPNTNYHPVAFNITSLASFVPDNIEKSLDSKTSSESIHLLSKSRYAASCLMYWLYMAMYHKLITQPQLETLGKELVKINGVLKCIVKYYSLRTGLTLSARSRVDSAAKMENEQISSELAC